MRKLGWYAVSAVVAAIILGGVVLLAGNLYVQSHGVQAQIQDALVSTLKMPVEIKKTTVTPWDGVRIDGITMRPENSTENFLTAASFRVQFAFLPLFSKKLVVQNVLLDQPEVSWAQNSEGRWQYPPTEGEKPVAATGKHHKHGLAREDKPAPLPAAGTAPTPETPIEALSSPTPPDSAPGESPLTPAPVVSAASPPEESAPPTPAAPLPAPVEPARESKPANSSADRIAVAVDKLKLRHGILNFLDSHRRPVGRFEDVNLDSKLAGNDHAAGALWFDKASLPRVGVTLTDFHSGFTYKDEVLVLRDGNGELAGGKIQLDYQVELRKPGSPFSATCHVKDVSLDELIVQAGGGPKLAEGRLHGDVQMSGESGDPDNRHATGQIRMMDARFKNLPLLQTIGEALRIEDISHLQFKKAQLDCVLEGTVLHVNPLVLVSNDLQIMAQGDYRIDEDRLGLRARLTIDRAISRQLPQFIESNFQPCGDEAPGSRYMDFDITGSVSKPKSDLFAKILSGSANSFLQNLFGSKKKHDKKQSRHEENSQPPSDQDDSGGNDH